MIFSRKEKSEQRRREVQKVGHICRPHIGLSKQKAVKSQRRLKPQFWTSKTEPISCCVTPELVEFSSGLNQYCCNLRLNSEIRALKQSIVLRIIFYHPSLRLSRTFLFWKDTNHLLYRVSEIKCLRSKRTQE